MALNFPTPSAPGDTYVSGTTTWTWDGTVWRASTLDGYVGATGLAGATGLPGASGYVGSDGSTGASGMQGLTGATGASGVLGNTGATGASGTSGLTGSTGASGTSGLIGATGASGVSADQTLNTNSNVTFNQITSTGNTIVSGQLKIEQVDEAFTSIANATGTVVHNCANGQVFYHTTPAANWTANLTNLNLDSSYVTNITLVIVQGSTPYVCNAVTISGSAQSVQWQASTVPTGYANKTDIMSFSIINSSGTYTVLGQLVSFN